MSCRSMIEGWLFGRLLSLRSEGSISHFEGNAIFVAQIFYINFFSFIQQKVQKKKKFYPQTTSLLGFDTLMQFT